MLGQERKAIEIYNELIAEQPEFPGHYANRGIAFDRLGQHRKALDDYETALNMDPEVAGGPNWLTRFLRNQAEKPPG
ncbi:MAG: tetratricopeptide repeat protein, partial [Phycisphaerae bacterium]|nr:tetratricopeptide repeat protein [Phycisphaerae bacterium]